MIGLELIMPAIDKVLNLIPDTNARAKAREDLQTQLLAISAQQDTQQADINKVEAASTNWFVASWRPALAWICISSLAWFYVLYPLISWIVPCFYAAAHIPAPNKPEDMQQIVYALLGIGTMRSFEKWKGVA